MRWDGILHSCGPQLDGAASVSEAPLSDVAAFWHGAPFLLDLGEHLTPWLNRMFFIGQAPYVLVMVIFVTVALVDLAKLAYEKSRRRLQDSAELQDRALVPAFHQHSSNGAVNLHDVVELSKAKADALDELSEEASTATPSEHSSEAVCSWLEKLKGPVVDRTPGTWQLYDREYDLTDFMARHPGGGRVLEMTRGSDATLLFESYHVMVSREQLESMMKPYFVKNSAINRRAEEASAPVLPPEDELHGEIKALVRRRLQKKPDTFGGKSHKMNYEAAAVRFSVLALGWYLNYRLVFYGDVYALVATPVAQWFSGAVLAHEGGHFSAFSNPDLNVFISFLGGWPFQFNSSAWLVQHTIQHHQYTDSYADVDLFHYLPAVRMSRHHTKWNFIFKHQWWLIFFLIPTVSAHLTFAVPIDLLLGRPVYIGPLADDSVPEKEKAAKRYHQCVHLRQVMKVLKWPMLLEVAGLVAYWMVLIQNQGWFKGVLYYTFIMIMSSWFFIMFTQGAHTREDIMDNVARNCQFDDEGKNTLSLDTAAAKNANKEVGELTLQGFDDKGGFQQSTFKSSNPIMGRWVREQIHYTVDFCTASRFWLYWSGGLNMQALHHCMPGVSHCHLTDMYPEFVQICRKYDVEVRACTSFTEFVWGFIHWIRCLSIEDELFNREKLDWAEKQEAKSTSNHTNHTLNPR